MKNNYLLKLILLLFAAIYITPSLAQNRTETNDFFIKAFSCNPATNLEVNFTPACNALLTWNAPAKNASTYEGWIQKCWNGDGGWVFGDWGMDHIGTIRFTPSDLNDLGVQNGQTITKVLLGLGQDLNNISLMELRIWEGGTSITNPGTLVVQQPITNYTTFIENGWNEVLLTVPFAIDITKELRIGYRIVSSGGFPFGGDYGPAVPNGNIFYVASWGTWVNMNNYLVDGEFNLKIKAFVTSMDGEFELYNIYRDENLIKENYPLTSYVDYGSSPIQAHSWAVEVVCSAGGVSNPVSLSKPPCTLPSYTVSLSANPTNGGTVTGGGTYLEGSNVTAIATANTGYVFTNWTKEGTVVSTLATHSFPATENVALTANFELKTYTVSVSANPTSGGTVFGNGTYTHGENATVFAAPATGYIFVNWTQGGETVSTNEIYVFPAIQDAILTANFILDVGVTDIEKVNGFTLYPNPANDLLKVVRTTAGMAKIEIYNNMGVLIQSLECNEVETTVNVSAFASGVYFIRLTDGLNSSLQRFVKK
jgi:hypothetical protein